MAEGVQGVWEDDRRDDARPVETLALLAWTAIFWIVVNQFRDHLGLHAGARIGLVAKGYLGASLFFVIGGFAAARTYAQAREQGQRSHFAMLRQWIIDVYPLHILGLAATGMIFFGALTSHAAFQASLFDPTALPANVLLVQAWGIAPTVSWDFPSWLISAEWFALLVLPVTVWVAFKLLRWPWLVIGTAISLFIAMFVVANRIGVLFTDMTAQIGALQTVPAFLLGTGLYQLMVNRPSSRASALLLALAAGFWIALASFLRLTDLVIWPAFAPLVLAVSALDVERTGGPVNRWVNLLAPTQYALLLVYLPVDIVYFHIAKSLVAAPSGALSWLILLGVFPTILLVSVGAYWWFQRPVAASLSPKVSGDH